MRIKNIISQHRRDFRAIYECEHCKYTFEDSGYDDMNFHENVIPNTKCKKCGKISGDDFSPRTPKYPEGMTV